MIHGGHSLPCEFEDPFACSSLVSLLPRTLGVPLLAPPAASESDETNKVKSLLASMILDGPKAVLEQAQTISNSCQSVVSSSQELDTASSPGPDADFSILADTRDPKEHFMTDNQLDKMDKEIKSLRGDVHSESSKNQEISKRKRGVFGRTYTFKPPTSIFPTATTNEEFTASQQLEERTTYASNSNLGPDVDFSILDHIRDPEEYFRTYRRLEEADKEIKRLRGEGPSESSKNQQINERKRRPGLFGRTYTFKVPKEFSVSQQLEERTSSLSKVSTLTETNENTNPDSIDQPHNLDSMETNNKLTAAVETKVPKEKDRNDLEKLISAFKDLDNDEGRALLYETLQIKPIEIKELELPKLPTCQSPLRKNLAIYQLPQTSQTLLKKTDDVLEYWRRHLLDNVYMKPRPDGSSYSGESSPNTSRQKKTVTSPIDVSYSDQIGLFTSDTSLPATSADKNLSLVNELQTPLNKADETTDKVAAQEAGRDQAEFSPETITGGMHRAVTNDERCFDVIDKQKEDAGEDALSCSLGSIHHTLINDERCSDVIDKQKEDAGEDALSCSLGSMHHALINDERCSDVIDKQQDDAGEDALSCSLGSMHHALINDERCSDVITNQKEDAITVKSPVIPLASAEACTENSISMETILPVDVQSQDASLVAGKNVETHEFDTTFGMSTNNEEKQEVVSGTKMKQKKKSISGRKSLIDAGLMWNSGVRRSTRIKSRPLEYWRGERFLYGRIHNSLATVIGVKRASASIEGGLKVKSFVSEQHADLVARAALH